MAQIQVRNEQGEPLARINVRISEGEKPTEEAIFDIFTDLAGNSGWPIPFWPDADYTLHVNTHNVDIAYQSTSVFVPKGQTDNVAITLPKIVVPEDPALFPPEKGRLHIVGEHFFTEDNQPWQWRGFSYFLGYRDFKNGKDIRPDLRWLRKFGFNLIRVFGPLPWAETPDYSQEHWDASKLGAFFDTCAEEGVRVEFVPLCYAYSLGRQRTITQQVYDVARTRWNVLVEVSNEPHRNDIDPVAVMQGINRYGILSAYGLYNKFYDNKPDFDPTLDYATLHTTRDDAWHRKARHAQEWQHAINKPCISDEPAKLTEPGFHYVGGKNSPEHTPHEAAWHFGICCLWTAGGTVHTEEGKWGRVPQPGMLQYTDCEFIRDLVWKKITPGWQMGDYTGSHFQGITPVDHIEGVWTYSTRLHGQAVSIRCEHSSPNPVNGYRLVSKWGQFDEFVHTVR